MILDFPYYIEREKRTKQYSLEFLSLMFLFGLERRRRRKRKKFLKNFNPCVCGNWKHYGRTIQLILLYYIIRNLMKIINYKLILKSK